MDEYTALVTVHINKCINNVTAIRAINKKMLWMTAVVRVLLKT